MRMLAICNVDLYSAVPSNAIERLFVPDYHTSIKWQEYLPQKKGLNGAD